MSAVLIEKGETKTQRQRRFEDTQGECHGKTEDKMVRVQVREQQRTPEAKKGAWNRSFPSTLSESMALPANTLLSDFWPPLQGDHRFLLC